MLNVETAKKDIKTKARRSYRDRDQFRFHIVAMAFCGDFAVIGVAALVASWLRFGDFVSGNALHLMAVVLFPYVLAALSQEAFRIEHLRKRLDSIRRVVVAFLVSFVIAVIAAFAFKVSATYSRLETGYLVVLAVLGLILWRAAFSSIVNRWFAAIAEPVIIVLSDKAGLADERLRDGATEIIDVNERGWTSGYNDPNFLDDLGKAIGNADRVILAFGDDQVRHDWITLVRIKGLHAEVWQPDLILTQTLGLNDLNGTSTLIVSRGPLHFNERIAKRTFDLGLTIPALILLSPLMAFLAVLIKLESPGPVVFVQKRVGRKNQPISVYKFRTIHDELRDEKGKHPATKNDERMTRLGPFLRSTSFDELPQLINVLMGSMSLVGPRPHPYGTRVGGNLFWNIVENYWDRHKIKPGITGLAQVRGFRGPILCKEDLENRLESDIEYISNWSISLDVKILMRTLRVIFHSNA